MRRKQIIMNHLKNFCSFFLMMVSSFSFAQSDFTFHINSYPDSSDVYINGDFVGTTPLVLNKTIDYSKYYLYQFILKKVGYKSEVVATYRENELSATNVVISHNLTKNRYKADSTIDKWIAIDRVVIETKIGDTVGEVNKNGEKKPLIIEKAFSIATSEFNELADEELTISGYRTKPKAKLFAGEVGEEQPYYLLGANMKNLRINYKVNDSTQLNFGTKSPPSISMICKMDMEWQVFSRVKKGVILKIQTRGESFSFSNQDIEKIVKDAVKDALVNLGYDSTFRNTIAMGSGTQVHTTKQIKNTSLKLVKPEAFTDYASMIQKKLSSCVTILVTNGHGSGFIISNEGHIITNYHVIDGTKELNIKFENGFEFPAEVISFDEDYDVALIKIKGSGFKGLPLNTSIVRVGSDVTAIGTPAKIELGQTVTKGIISGKREIEGKLYYQTDVSVSPGSSGGPLFNSKGEVIGITTWVIRGGGTEGLNFAIPTSVVVEKLGITFY